MLVATFAAAAFGSFVAVALQSWLSRRGSQAHFRALVGALRDEIRSIESQATERSKRDHADIQLDPPYPDDAWQVIVSSAEVRRLGAQYAPLAHFYSAVKAANHRGAQVAILLQVSATAPHDDVRLAYRGLAQRFSGPAHADVLDRLPGASVALAKLGT